MSKVRKPWAGGGHLTGRAARREKCLWGTFMGEVGTMSEIQQRHWRRGLEEGERALSWESAPSSTRKRKTEAPGLDS